MPDNSNNDGLKELVEQLKRFNDIQQTTLERQEIKEMLTAEEERTASDSEGKRAEDDLRTTNELKEKEIKLEKELQETRNLQEFRSNIEESLTKIESKDYSSRLTNIDMKLLQIENSTEYREDQEELADTANLIIIALIFIAMPIYYVMKILHFWFDDVVA